jgi:hypothetical protein
MNTRAHKAEIKIMKKINLLPIPASSSQTAPRSFFDFHASFVLACLLPAAPAYQVAFLALIAGLDLMVRCELIPVLFLLCRKDSRTIAERADIPEGGQYGIPYEFRSIGHVSDHLIESLIHLKGDDPGFFHILKPPAPHGGITMYYFPTCFCQDLRNFFSGFYV